MRQREHPHVEMLRRFPELGEDFGLRDVLEFFEEFVWEAHVAGRDELVRRALGFVEWLAEHGREGVPWHIDDRGRRQAVISVRSKGERICRRDH